MIGYQCSHNRNFNVGLQTKRTSTIFSERKNEMGGSGAASSDALRPRGLPSTGGASGSGIMDIARSILATGATVAAVGSAVKNAYTSQTATNLRNMLPDSDDTARPGFAGEAHAILKLPNGKNGVANYMGPNTNIIERIKRGDPGRTEVDKVSKARDIRYAKAKNFEDIRNADNIMIREVNQIAQNKSDNPRNIFVARAIAGKVKLEDMGLLKKDAFSGDLSKKKLSPENDALLTTALNQQGYGLKLAGQRGKGVILPGDALKIKLMKQIIKKKKKRSADASTRLGEPLGRYASDRATPAKKTSMLKKPQSANVSSRLGETRLETSASSPLGAKGSGRATGKKMKGGFFPFLVPIIALITEAISGITVASVGSAVATGAASAVGASIVKKIVGSGKNLKGKGIQDMAKVVAKKLKEHKDVIIQTAKAIGITESDLPETVLNVATKTLETVANPSKENILEVVKVLIPHVRKAFQSKLESTVKAGSGLSLPGQQGYGIVVAGKGLDIDSKILAVVSKQI